MEIEVVHRCSKDVSSGCKKAEASLHIENVIHQSSCFSETIVMSIAPPNDY